MKRSQNRLCLILVLSLLVVSVSLILAGCGDYDGPTVAITTPSGDPVTLTPAQTDSTPTPEQFPNRPNADTKNGTPKELSVGDVAPEFTIKMLDGSQFRMSEHDKEVVLLNFWATWCGPCVKEMPDLIQLANDGIEGFSVCLISVGDSLSEVNDFIKQKNYPKSLIACADGTAIDEYYPSQYIPYTVIVQNGIVKGVYVGSRSYSDYRKIVDGIIGK